MNLKLLCARHEECQIVLAACERKVKAESAQRLAEAKLAEATDEYDAKKKVMNELYSAGLSMRQAQRDYFKNRDQKRLYVSKNAEDRFDKALRACHALAHPNQPALVFPI